MQMEINSGVYASLNKENLIFFEKLELYISQYDNKWKKNIKPATREEIDLLNELSGVKDSIYEFPKIYELFLLYMGEDDGELLRRQVNGTTSIKEILQLYRDINEYEPENLNPRYLDFVSTELGGEISFDLEKNKNFNIVETVDGDYEMEYAESFEKLLWQCAFKKYERVRYKHCVNFGSSLEMIKKFIDKYKSLDIFNLLEKFIDENNFQKLWFSDKRHYVLSKDGVSCYICTDRNGAIGGFVCGKSSESVNEVIKQLRNEIEIIV